MQRERRSGHDVAALPVITVHAWSMLRRCAAACRFTRADGHACLPYLASGSAASRCWAVWCEWFESLNDSLHNTLSPILTKDTKAEIHRVWSIECMTVASRIIHEMCNILISLYSWLVWLCWVSVLSRLGGFSMNELTNRLLTNRIQKKTITHTCYLTWSWHDMS